MRSCLILAFRVSSSCDWEAFEFYSSSAMFCFRRSDWAMAVASSYFPDSMFSSSTAIYSEWRFSRAVLAADAASRSIIDCFLWESASVLCASKSKLICSWVYSRRVRLSCNWRSRRFACSPSILARCATSSSSRIFLSWSTIYFSFSTAYYSASDLATLAARSLSSKAFFYSTNSVDNFVIWSLLLVREDSVSASLCSVRCISAVSLSYLDTESLSWPVTSSPLARNYRPSSSRRDLSPSFSASSCSATCFISSIFISCPSLVF